MSWSVTVVGDQSVVGEAFDAERKRSAGFGMPEPEQRDIDEARDMAMQLASTYGRVTVNASGHWSGGKFASMAIRVDAADD